ncbi:hypothetical protein ACLB1E_18140 [Escherichia coli]
MFVINNEGKAIPLLCRYFAKWRPADASLSVNHQDYGQPLSDHLV